MLLKPVLGNGQVKKDIKLNNEFVNINGLTYKVLTCNGFSLIGLLLFIAVTGICLSVAGISWQYQVRSEKEQQLLFVGGQFRDAINSYYTSSPAEAKAYPPRLNDLLLDNRMPNVKRHLRKIYSDPMTGKNEWGLVTQQGRIVGVFSLSSLAPIKHKGFKSQDAKFIDAKSYQDWIFGQVGGVKTLPSK
jgi:type II secretory pathway pseudopilin PulG